MNNVKIYLTEMNDKGLNDHVVSNSIVKSELDETKFSEYFEYNISPDPLLNSEVTLEKLNSVATPGTSELSDYTITSGGIIEEQWDIIQTIPARLLEVNENHVILECLIDVENKTFQNRKFEKDLLEGIIPLVSFYPLIIRIFKRKGERKFNFIDGKNLIDISLFEENYFQDLNPEFFNKKF